MGRPIHFKRLSLGGNILAMNVDLEAAQVLGAADSFLPTNEHEYSGITTNDPAVLAEYFIKACHTHFKRYAAIFMTEPIETVYQFGRAVLDFEGLVGPEEYHQLLNFPYLESREQVDKFTYFVRGLNIKKINGSIL